MLTTSECVRRASLIDNTSGAGWRYWQEWAQHGPLAPILAGDLSAGIVPLLPTGITVDAETRAALAYVEAAERG